MKKGYLVALIVLAVLTLFSLTLNSVVILGLLRARHIALGAVAEARAVVTGISDDTFSYTFEVDQDIPVAASVPFSEEVTVPIHTTLPISMVVAIPINAGLLGTFDIDVPIRTVVPIDLAVAVPISKTVGIATTVPLDLDVPIEVHIADTPLVGYLEELDAALARAEARLRRPLGDGD
ncbi:MAG: hypothetical protein SWK90_15255 [Chloroflexota bacterium]|nr:hypothetical protein [Chloroflexota bacterium]